MILITLLLCAAQNTFEIPGTSRWDGMGMSTFILDDLNGDGVAEMGGAAFCTDYNGANSGSVYVYDGAAATQIRRHDGAMRSSRLGRFATSIDDINGDGVRDYAAGAPLESTFADAAGAVYVWSGATGQRLAWISGDVANGKLGTAIASIDDLDGDGTPDLLVGAPGERSGDGRIYAFSGATGLEIDHYNGRSSNGGFGTSLDAVGDVNGDGIEDFAGGEPFAHSNKGDVHIISGSNFHRIRTISGANLNAWFGYRVACIGDADGDGKIDMLIGEPCKDTVHLYNISGSRLRKHEGPGAQSGGPKQGWGHSIASAGDLDEDGYDDYVLGAPGEWAGFNFVNPGAATKIFSGWNGSLLLSVPPTGADDGFGSSLCVGIATPSNGKQVLLIGAPAAGNLSNHQATGLVFGVVLP